MEMVLIFSFVAVFIIAAFLGFVIWYLRTPCKHSYERIDKHEDKQMILVCRKCGKIRKLRK